MKDKIYSMNLQLNIYLLNVWNALNWIVKTGLCERE